MCQDAIIAAEQSAATQTITLVVAARVLEPGAKQQALAAQDCGTERAVSAPAGS